jgi:hemolysin III
VIFAEQSNLAHVRLVSRTMESSTVPVDVTKPRMRGWLHGAMFPISVVLGVVLVATAPDQPSRISSAVFAATAVMLFGVSAMLHLGSWSPRVEGLLRRLDHANIYLIIAGTYTPFAVLALPRTEGRILLLIVWSGALAGAASRLLWTDAPRWLTTTLYVVVGWVAVLFLPGLIEGAGIPVVVLIVIGGILYTLGAVVYATKRPDPSPATFGFHEVFHLLTVAAFATHYLAVWLVVHQ